MEIKLKQGLDLPLTGKPSGLPRQIQTPEFLSLNLQHFEDLRFKLLVKPGSRVKIGEPLIENKACSGQFFVSPAAGEVSEIRRGLKRRLLDIVIRVDSHEEWISHPKLTAFSKEEILERMLVGGVFPYIRTRPFNRIATPSRLPRDIFVSVVESAPFTPAAVMQLVGNEEDFQVGLQALSKLTTGKVHLVKPKGTDLHFSGVEHHTISGPHPIGNPSVHIHHIAPIQHAQDVVWTLSTIGVIVLGHLLRQGRTFTPRIIGLGGEGVVEGCASFFAARAGFPLSALLRGRLKELPHLIVSGNPLSGTRAEKEDFLGFHDTSVSVILIATSREPFHFLRLGLRKFSATRTYLSGFLSRKNYLFTTSQHGEERAFIDGSIYKKVMPMRIPTIQLIKAILAEDFELAEQLGLLEVAPEDFSLPTFICPSKIEMVEIVKRGLHAHATELGF